MKANEISKGTVVDFDGKFFIARSIEVRQPSSRGAPSLYKTRFVELKSGQNIIKSLRGDEVLKDVRIEKKKMQYLYQDAEMAVFMDNEDFGQYFLPMEIAKDRLSFITENSDVLAVVHEESILDVDLPDNVCLKITETSPALKGGGASGRMKPAVLETGLEVQVPESFAINDSVKISTETAKFLGRA